jgi:hypothetical protein
MGAGNLHPDSVGALAIFGETAGMLQKHLLEDRRKSTKITEMSRKMMKKAPVPLIQVTCYTPGVLKKHGHDSMNTQGQIGVKPCLITLCNFYHL